MWIALAIAVLTLALVFIRPRPLNEGSAAAIGAVLMLAFRQVQIPQTLEVLSANSNVLLFFLGLMAMCGVAEQAHVFDWMAREAMTLARGNGRKLFLIVFALGAVVTMFLSNDSTALILTPVVFALVSQLKIDPLPYMFATGFIANTASSLLPISNPVNLLAVDTFSLGLGGYLRYLLAASLAAIAINCAIFFFVFHKNIPVRFKVDYALPPIKKDGLFKFTGIVMLLTAAGYIALSLHALPLSIVALGGAAALLVGGAVSGRLDWKGVRGRMSWSILVFIYCLAIVVKGLENAGVIRSIGQFVVNMASGSHFTTIMSITLATAVGSNLVNNWSMMMLSVSSLQHAYAINGLHQGAAFAAVLGADIGPNLTTVGSLSTILWLVLLRQRGIHIHPSQYFKLGLLVVPPMLLVGAALIYLAGRFP